MMEGLGASSLGHSCCVTLGQFLTLSELGTPIRVTKNLDLMSCFHKVAAIVLSLGVPPILSRTLGPGEGAGRNPGGWHNL